MGSPLSPLLADIFMDNLEKQIFNSGHPQLKNVTYWYRYVDDIIVLWTGTYRQLKNFTDFLNSIHANIQFTVEKENENRTLNFLDLSITLVNDRHAFDIYRKPTHTDTVIHNSSQHPPSHKHAAFHSMVHRLFSIPLSPRTSGKKFLSLNK